ncbi:hypothetical protein DOTSEDRAFT_69848 [Dothistroma septosporum NZE10]|uniref:Uncharacterized protein n=1 Tax=Dothistroma septosporum (strain NZE10 / CBS 128990) TaxID=675120 RepID=N1Q077_DOTSN|nr:hypothetical protein DOTSEDRAFT_69848 [Dothistroma septosporum NZE10]
MLHSKRISWVASRRRKGVKHILDLRERTMSQCPSILEGGRLLNGLLRSRCLRAERTSCRGPRQLRMRKRCLLFRRAGRANKLRTDGSKEVDLERVSGRGCRSTLPTSR